MYLEILLTIWFVLWLFTKIGLFPDYIKNSWDTADIKLMLESISKQIDRLTVQVTLTEVEKKAYAEARVEEHENYMKEKITIKADNNIAEEFAKAINEQVKQDKLEAWKYELLNKNKR